jgi:hypothetical protein
LTLRRQLTLFVPRDRSAAVEAVRRVLDPVQHRLIPAHVTLCREDEIARLSHLQTRRLLRSAKPIELRFGPPATFSSHGILLPCISGEQEFHGLRALLLVETQNRRASPHLTLAHPRNPKAAGNSLAHAADLPQDLVIPFPTVSLIEQEGNSPWRLLRTYELNR